MKKILFFTFLAAIFNTQVLSQTFEACSDRDLKFVESDLNDWKKDGMDQSSYIKNKEDKVIGYYVWNNDGEMVASICEGLSSIYYEEDFLVSEDWYYWNQEDVSTEPKSWTAGAVYSISQDEGFAEIKVKKVDLKNKVVEFELSVKGWDESQNERVVRKEVVYISWL